MPNGKIFFFKYFLVSICIYNIFLSLSHPVINLFPTHFQLSSKHAYFENLPFAHCLVNSGKMSENLACFWINFTNIKCYVNLNKNNCTEATKTSNIDFRLRFIGIEFFGLWLTKRKHSSFSQLNSFIVYLHIEHIYYSIINWSDAAILD